MPRVYTDVGDPLYFNGKTIGLAGDAFEYHDDAVGDLNGARIFLERTRRPFSWAPPIPSPRARRRPSQSPPPSSCSPQASRTGRAGVAAAPSRLEAAFPLSVSNPGGNSA